MATFLTDADFASGTGETVEAEVWLATEFTVPSGTLNALRWRFPAGIISVTPVMRIFNAGGTALEIGGAGVTTLSFGALTAGQFNTATLPTPIALAAGTYRVTVNTTRYVFKSGFFTAGSITRGDIIGVRGRFGAPGSAPASTSTTLYGPDIDFTADATAVAPNSLSVPVALGAPAADPSITTAPDGLSVPVALGAPAADPGITTAPSSLSVPVSLGEPSVIFVPTPDSLSVPVSLGAPTVGQAAGAGGWRDLSGIIAGAREDARINAERRRNPVECPIHGWPLETNSRGVKHCLFGGHVVTGGW